MAVAATSPSVPQSPGQHRPGLLWIGLLALACYAAHATRQLIHDRPENLLWTCHLAAALVGVGAIARSRNMVAAGALLLTVGLPLWAIDLAIGSEFFVTSVFTHVGGLSLALIALRRLGGLPSRAWWDAMLVVTVMITISRLATLPSANVNLAFRAWSLFASFLPAGPAHLWFLLAQWGVLLILARWLVTRLCPPRN